MKTETNARPIRISLYDDNVEFCISMQNLFDSIAGFEFLGFYPNPKGILEHCTQNKPDIILMDIDMPGFNGIDGLKKLKAHIHCIKVLMLTVFDDNQKIFESICNGADGYILKQAGPLAIVDAVKEAYHDGAPMTNSIAAKVLNMFRAQAPAKEPEFHLSLREKEILTNLTKGFTYKMIATACEISIDTVRFHIRNIYDKLHVHSMSEAVSKALRNKWV